MDVQDSEPSFTDDCKSDDVFTEKKMALLLLNLESTFNVYIRHTDQDVEELIVALTLHQVQSSQTFYSHV